MIERGEHGPVELSKCFLPPAPLPFVRYDSRSEFALAELFKKYIPGWLPVMNDTIQISIGFNRTVDFRIENTLLEYHPIMINREMKSSHANQIFRQAFARSNKWERSQLVEMLVEELGAQYAHRRAQLVAASPHAGKHLIVCGGPEEVHRSILQQFGKGIPNLSQFKTEFHGHVQRGNA